MDLPAKEVLNDYAGLVVIAGIIAIILAGVLFLLSALIGRKKRMAETNMKCKMDTNIMKKVTLKITVPKIINFRLRIARWFFTIGAKISGCQIEIHEREKENELHY